MNRLVKAAAARLGLMRIRSPQSRADLGWVDATLENVAAVEFAPNALPAVSFNRLNGHYREIVALALLILRYSTIETERGVTRAAGFLMDMNRVFSGLRDPSDPRSPQALGSNVPLRQRHSRCDPR